MAACGFIWAAVRRRGLLVAVPAFSVTVRRAFEKVLSSRVLSKQLGGGRRERWICPRFNLKKAPFRREGGRVCFFSSLRLVSGSRGGGAAAGGPYTEVGRLLWCAPYAPLASYVPRSLCKSGLEEKTLGSLARSKRENRRVSRAREDVVSGCLLPKGRVQKNLYPLKADAFFWAVF